MHWGDVLTLLRAPKMVNQPLIVSSPTAVQEVNKDIPEVEQNSSTDNTSVSSCVSSLTAVQDLMKTLPKLNRTETLIKLQCTAGTTVCLPTPLCRMLIKAFPVKSKGASAITTTVLLRLCLWFMTEENNSTALSSDIFWKTEEEIIHLSLKGNTGQFTTTSFNVTQNF